MSDYKLKDTTFLITCAAGREHEAKGELYAILPPARIRRLFLKGNLLLKSEEEYAAVIDLLAEAETETIGRVTAVHAKCPVSEDEASIETLIEACRELPPVDAGGSFCVRCDRRGQHDWNSEDVEVAAGAAIVDETGASVDLENPGQILSVDVFQDRAYLGVCGAERMLKKEITKARIWAPGERPLNRSELKLWEIIDEFDVQLPEDGAAVDLGASPGGWSKVLAEYLSQVIAVDPADIDEAVSELPNVRHIRSRAEDVIDRDDIGPFDILVNDMNMEPDESARIMCRCRSLLKSGAIIIMTVKFVSRRRSEHIAEATGILKNCFEQLRVRRMPHNAKETTMVGRYPGGV